VENCWEFRLLECAVGCVARRSVKHSESQMLPHPCSGALAPLFPAVLVHRCFLARRKRHEMCRLPAPWYVEGLVGNLGELRIIERFAASDTRHKLFDECVHARAEFLRS